MKSVLSLCERLCYSQDIFDDQLDSFGIAVLGDGQIYYFSCFFFESDAFFLLRALEGGQVSFELLLAFVFDLLLLYFK